MPEHAPILPVIAAEVAALAPGFRALSLTVEAAPIVRPEIAGRAVERACQALARGEPDPDGLLRIARRWNVTPAELVMVGDYRFDLDCGRAAGSRTVLVNLPENPWPELADWHAADCHALLEQLQTP